MISSYIDFVKENKQHREFGCVMLDLTVRNWKGICNKIVHKDIYEAENPIYGICEDPHLTIFYGVHSDVEDIKVAKIIDRFKDRIDGLEISISGVEVFRSKGRDYDVLKMGVEANDLLQEFHNAVKKLPHSTDFDEYQPHITIAYLKRNRGDKYVSKLGDKFSIKINSISYSKPPQKIKFDL